MDITSAEFNSRYYSGNLVIIDVREEIEFQTFNLGGRNIPLGKLLAHIEDIDYNKDEEIVVVCQRGLRSETARRALVGYGYTHVRNLVGGILGIQKLNTKTSSN